MKPAGMAAAAAPGGAAEQAVGEIVGGAVENNAAVGLAAVDGFAAQVFGSGLGAAVELGSRRAAELESPGAQALVSVEEPEWDARRTRPEQQQDCGELQAAVHEQLGFQWER
jgi:hypothetical protein